MRSIALLVVISVAAFVVVDARSLGRGVQLEDIPVRVVYDTDPLETVYTKVIVKGMVEPNENDDRQENKFETLTVPEEVLAVVEEVTKEDNRETDILQVPVNIIPQSDLEVIVQPGAPSNKESTITEVVVNLDGSEITKDENKVELSQELLPPAAKPSVVVVEEHDDNKQNELSDVEQNNKINGGENVSAATEKPETSHVNDVDAVLSEEQNKRDKEELLYALRFSESHPAQVPTRKSSAAVKEENKVEAEESSTEVSSTAVVQPSTEKVERPKPIAFIQNLINTVRPANVVQAIVNRNKGNDKKDGIKEPEKVEENVYVPPKLEISSAAPTKQEVVTAPPKQEDTVAPSSPISSFQTTFNSQLDNFRETVNSALNNLRPTPKPDAEGDPTVQRPFVDALQSTFNNGVNTLSNSVNNAIASLAPQSSGGDQQSVPQQLQNVIQNSLNQFGQSVSGALNLRPRPDADTDAPEETGQNIAQIIQNALNSFVENINNFNKKPTDGTTALHDEEENNGSNNQAVQNQGPFAVALNGLQNFISNFRPSERPAESAEPVEGGAGGGGDSNRPPNPLQLIQNAGQTINNFINNLRPTRRPNTDASTTTTTTETATTSDETPNTDTDEKPHDEVNVAKPEKQPSKSD